MSRRRGDSYIESDGGESPSSASSAYSSSLSDGEVAFVARMLQKRRRGKKRRREVAHHHQRKHKKRSGGGERRQQRPAEWSPVAADDHRDPYQPPPGGGVYALQTLSGDAPAFYVGKSGNIEKRLQDHRDGLGTPYLAGSDFVQVPLCTEGSPDDLESWERNETLQRMLHFGVDNVRGWMFTDRHLQQADRRAAFAQICEKNDLCRRCGRGSHFKSSCFAKSTAPWANGLGVSP